MSNSTEGSANFSDVADLMERLSQEPLTPGAEGRIYVEWIQRINPLTGTRFKLQEVSLVVRRQYGHVRDRAALVRPYDPDEKVPYEPIGEVDLSQAGVARALRRRVTSNTSTSKTQGPTMQVLAIGINDKSGFVWSCPIDRNSMAADVAKRLRAEGSTDDVGTILVVESGAEGTAPPEVIRQWTAGKDYR